MKPAWLVIAAGVGLAGCAMKGDVQRVEYQLQSLRAETARADSARAAQFVAQVTEIIAAQQRLMDTLLRQQGRLTRLETLQGGVRSELTDVQRQLVQVQELLGQSQQRLSDLRRQLDQKQRQNVGAPGGSDSAPASAQADAQRLYDLSLSQLRRNSPQTARQGFQKLLTDYPTSERAVDAQFWIGDTWANANADSAAAAYELVVKSFATSPRAATALYKLGQLADAKSNKAAARQFYQRVIDGFPTSEEAALARDKLQSGH